MQTDARTAHGGYGRTFIRDQMNAIMRFYTPRARDDSGGFYHSFLNDGTVNDSRTRHLVSSTRFVFNYAVAHAAQLDSELSADLAACARHGIAFLEGAHRVPSTGGYAWLLEWDGETAHITDDTNHAYGLAFVLLAYSAATRSGVIARADGLAAISAVWDLLERHYYEPDHHLYADECNGDFSVCAPYRGQNANMHLCEALIEAWEATGEERYRQRAVDIARSVTVDLAARSGGLIWEHYHSDWTVDPDYNRDNPRHLFRPWGFQPGHLAEWAKLLMVLVRISPADWMPERAAALFDAAVSTAWDETYGGLCYGFAPDRTWSDTDKYYWVQAETITAAALLYDYFGTPVYRDWYRKLWGYVARTIIDHQHGGWYRILMRDNRPYSDEKSPPGKTDYHPLAMCRDLLTTRLTAE